MESEPYGDHSNTETVEIEGFYHGMVEIQTGSFPAASNQPWPQLKKLFWYDLHDDPNGYSWGLLEGSEQKCLSR